MVSWQQEVSAKDLVEIKKILDAHKSATGTTAHLEQILNSKKVKISPDFVRDVSEVLKQEHAISGEEATAARHLAWDIGEGVGVKAIKLAAQGVKKNLRGIDLFNQFYYVSPDDLAWFSDSIERGVFPLRRHVVQGAGRVGSSAPRVGSYEHYLQLYEKDAPWLWLHSRNSSYGGNTTNRELAAKAEVENPASKKRESLGYFYIHVKPTEHFVAPVLKTKIDDLKKRIALKYRERLPLTRKSHPGKFANEDVSFTNAVMSGLIDGAIKKLVDPNDPVAFLESLHEVYSDTLSETAKEFFVKKFDARARLGKPSGKVQFKSFLSQEDADFRGVGVDLRLSDVDYYASNGAYNQLVQTYARMADPSLRADYQSKLQAEITSIKHALSGWIKTSRDTSGRELYIAGYKNKLNGLRNQLAQHVAISKNKDAIALAKKKLDAITYQNDELRAELNEIRGLLKKVKGHTGSQQELWRVDFTPSHLDRVAGFVSKDCIERRHKFFDTPDVHNGKVYNAKNQWVGNIYVLAKTKAMGDGGLSAGDKKRVSELPAILQPANAISSDVRGLHIDGIQVPQKIDMTHFTRELVDKLGVIAKKRGYGYVTGNVTPALVSNHATVQRGYGVAFKDAPRVSVRFPSYMDGKEIYSVNVEKAGYKLLKVL